MSRQSEPCMCGDPYCPLCGTAQGTYTTQDLNVDSDQYWNSFTDQLEYPTANWNPLFKRWEIPNPKNAALSIELPLIVDQRELIDELIEHLEYCNWGDAWERECAEDLRKTVRQYQERNSREET